MLASQIKTSTRVAEVVKNNDPKTKASLKMLWDSNVPKQFLNNPSGRVYIIAVDDVIYKIGGSQAHGGIRSTWSSYCSGNSGRPSDRTYGINVLINEQLDLGKKIEIYMIQSERVQAQVTGLFDQETAMISAFKEMERKCLEDYFKIEKEYPEWNFKESNKDWPLYIQEGAAKLRKRG
jgi:hypothetical protein